MSILGTQNLYSRTCWQMSYQIQRWKRQKTIVSCWHQYRPWVKRWGDHVKLWSVMFQIVHTGFVFLFWSTDRCRCCNSFYFKANIYFRVVSVFSGYLLQADCDVRPDICQASYVAFKLARRQNCPVRNRNVRVIEWLWFSCGIYVGEILALLYPLRETMSSIYKIFCDFSIDYSV